MLAQVAARRHSSAARSRLCNAIGVVGLGGKFYGLQQAIMDLRAVTFRGSSWVENINSRLRTYYFLRRQIGPEYLELLQFYLNHHRYARSAVSSRVAKSPRELSTGE